MTTIAISPTDSTAGYQLNSSGAEQELNQGVASTFNTWVLTGTAANYDVFATLNSGTLFSGTTGTWLNLATTRSWQVQRTNNAAGTNSASLTIQIRPAGGGATLDTANVTLNATVDI
jgi:hypothetical protein